MVPTTRALELGPPVHNILAELENLLEPPLFDPARADFTLAIAASDYALSVLIEPFFTALREKAPGVRTLVRPLSQQLIGRQLETGDVDFALMVTGANPPPHVHDLFDEQFACIMREGHPAAEGAWTLDRFCSLDHALVAFDGGFEGITDSALALSGRTRRVVLSVASFLVLGAVVRSTDVVAVAPARLVSCMPGLIQRPPPLPLSGFTLSAGWHDRSHNDPSRTWARSLLAETSEQLLRNQCLPSD